MLSGSPTGVVTFVQISPACVPRMILFSDNIFNAFFFKNAINMTGVGHHCV